MIPLRVWLAATVGLVLIDGATTGLMAVMDWTLPLEVNVVIGAAAWLGPFSLAAWWDLRRTP